MTGETDRLRQPPTERFAGTEHVFDLRAVAAGLRDEAHLPTDGHRQVTLFHKGGLGLIAFDFESGGRLADHSADAFVTIVALTGELEVSTSTRTHHLPAGSLLVLDPRVVHDVVAHEASQMLLVVDRQPPSDHAEPPER